MREKLGKDYKKYQRMLGICRYTDHWIGTAFYKTVLVPDHVGLYTSTD